MSHSDLLNGWREKRELEGAIIDVHGHVIATVSLPRDGTFKGLELERNVSARGGVPWCGIQIIDLRTGGILEWIRLEGFIKELFDVGVIPGSRCPMA